MLSNDNLQRVAAAAHEDAKSFLEGFCNSDEFFRPWSEKSARSPRVLRLIRFVQEKLDLNVLGFKSLPASGFASWLFKSGHGSFTIAMDESQMKKWSRETGVPVEAQVVRSILHEVGHARLSPRLTEGQMQTFTPTPTAQEEEIAWAYAMIFLSLLLGDYSSTRRRTVNCDDAPKLLL